MLPNFLDEPNVAKLVDKILNRRIVTHDEDGKLTRAGAVAQLRKRWDMFVNAMEDDHPTRPKCVWRVGFWTSTLGRGATWEEAIANIGKSGKQKKGKQS